MGVEGRMEPLTPWTPLARTLCLSVSPMPGARRSIAAPEATRRATDMLRIQLVHREQGSRMAREAGRSTRPWPDCALSLTRDEPTPSPSRPPKGTRTQKRQDAAMCADAPLPPGTAWVDRTGPGAGACGRACVRAQAFLQRRRRSCSFARERPRRCAIFPSTRDGRSRRVEE